MMLCWLRWIVGLGLIAWVWFVWYFGLVWFCFEFDLVCLFGVVTLCLVELGYFVILGLWVWLLNSRFLFCLFEYVSVIALLVTSMVVDGYFCEIFFCLVLLYVFGLLGCFVLLCCYELLCCLWVLLFMFDLGLLLDVGLISLGLLIWLGLVGGFCCAWCLNLVAWYWFVVLVLCLIRLLFLVWLLVFGSALILVFTLGLWVCHLVGWPVCFWVFRQFGVIVGCLLLNSLFCLTWLLICFVTFLIWLFCCLRVYCVCLLID